MHKGNQGFADIVCCNVAANSVQFPVQQPRNIMATIYKTAQSRYYFARFSDGGGSGKRISRSTKSESKRDAKRIAGEFEAAARKAVSKAEVDAEIPGMIRRSVELAALESQQGRLTLQRAEELIRLMQQAANPGDTGVNFRRFAGAWLDSKEKSTAPATWRAYRDAVKLASGVLGSKMDGPMRNITVADMERVMASMAEGRRGKSVNYYFGEVRRIFESAVEKDIITKNPAKFVKNLPTGDSRKRVDFSTDEVRRILIHAPSSEWRELIRLAAQTGMRQGDLLELTGENIVGGWIQRLPSKTSTRSNEVLRIPLNPESLAWLEGRAGYLFPMIRATESRSRPFKKAMKAAGVSDRVVLAAGDPPVIGIRSFHSLRHCVASWLAEAGIPADVRMKFVSHKSSKVHALYTHHNEALVRAVAALPSL